MNAMKRLTLFDLKITFDSCQIILREELHQVLAESKKKNEVCKNYFCSNLRVVSTGAQDAISVAEGWKVGEEDFTGG